jgi:hypothetical protein
VPSKPHADQVACGGEVIHVRLSFQPYFFSEETVFFSRYQSANNIFQLVFSAKRT